MSSSCRWISIAATFAILVGTALSQTKPYPKPRVASATGQIAPDFALKDQDGKDVRLSDQRGHWVLLFFYRGYWWPYCMAELGEFAQHSNELDTVGVRLIPISVDGRQRAHQVWEKVANKKFTILSDPGATVIRKYGLLHEDGGVAYGGADIALRATILIDPDGREQWRRVSRSVPDIPNWTETLAAIRASREREHGLDQNHRWIGGNEGS